MMGKRKGIYTVASTVLMVTLMVLVLSLGAANAWAGAGGEIKVVFNGEAMSFDVPPQIINGRTMVPMRAIFEALGASVEWDPEEQSISALTKAGESVLMQIGNTAILIEHGGSGVQIIPFDTAPVIVDGRTFVPVRAVSECLGASVEWVEETQTVFISNVFTMPARDIVTGIRNGYGNDGVAEMQYNARYALEQYALPELVVEYQREIGDYIAAGHVSGVNEFLTSVWEIVAMETVIADMRYEENDLSVETVEQLMLIIDGRLELFGLGVRPMASMTIERLDFGASAAIISMEETGWALLSSYYAIVRAQDGALQCYSLERSYDNADGTPYFFCAIYDGSRANLGIIGNSMEAFLMAINGDLG